ELAFHGLTRRSSVFWFGAGLVQPAGPPGIVGSVRRRGKCLEAVHMYARRTHTAAKRGKLESSQDLPYIACGCMASCGNFRIGDVLTRRHRDPVADRIHSHE